MGRSTPPHGKVRSSNHDRGFGSKRRMGRIETSDLKLITSEPMVGKQKAKPSTRAKWRSSLSACRGVGKKGIDRAGVVRDAIYRQPWRNVSAFRIRVTTPAASTKRVQIHHPTRTIGM